MIVVLWVQWHQEAVLGSVSKDPGPKNMFQNVLSNASQRGKATAHTKAFS